MSGRQRIERQVRAIPLWLLQEYLLELGGHLVVAGHVQGPDWDVYLEKLEDFRIGSLSIGQVNLIVEAEPEALAELMPRLEKKLMRAGG